MAEPVRIAMWSGPRNISTAMMRSFENRSDTSVVDEPFYACFLDATGIRHPGRETVLAACETDPAAVAATLVGRVPHGREIWYQKHDGDDPCGGAHATETCPEPGTGRTNHRIR